MERSHTSWLFSVSLLWGNTKASSSEPEQEDAKGSASFQRERFALQHGGGKGKTPAVTLGSRVGARGARAGPRCVLVFLQARNPHQISAVLVAVYPTV